MLLAQLTAIRDEQQALLSCLAFGRTFSRGIDLAGQLTSSLALRRLRTGKSPRSTHRAKLDNDQPLRWICLHETRITSVVGQAHPKKKNQPPS